MLFEFHEKVRPNAYDERPSIAPPLYPAGPRLTPSESGAIQSLAQICRGLANAECKVQWRSSVDVISRGRVIATREIDHWLRKPDIRIDEPVAVTGGENDIVLEWGRLAEDIKTNWDYPIGWSVVVTARADWMLMNCHDEFLCMAHLDFATVLRIQHLQWLRVGSKNVQKPRFAITRSDGTTWESPCLRTDSLTEYYSRLINVIAQKAQVQVETDC